MANFNVTLFSQENGPILMAQFSVKKNAQFDEAFFSKEKLPILMALKKKQKNGRIGSDRIVPPISFVSIAFKSPKKGRF